MSTSAPYMAHLGSTTATTFDGIDHRTVDAADLSLQNEIILNKWDIIMIALET